MSSSLKIAALLLAGLMTMPALADQLVDTPKGQVAIPDAPERIVILNPALAGSVYALGLDVLAVTQSTRSPTEEGYARPWADAARASGTQVLPWDFEGFNLEAILNLDPDLIIAGGQGRPGFLADQAYGQLSAIAPTLFVDTKPVAWQDELSTIADALGKADEEAKALEAYAERVAQVKAAIDLPRQPTVFVMATKPGAELYFLPETSSTPLLFADVGFTPDPLMQEHPDFEAASTGDGVKVSLERASELLDAPTLVFVPFTAGAVSLADLAADPVLSRIPALASGEAHEFADYAYRFDYFGAMAVLDDIEKAFAR